MLFIVDHEILDALRDGVGGIHDADFEGPQGRVPDVGAALNLPINFGIDGNVAVVMQRVEAVAGRHELLQRARLIFGQPEPRLRFREVLFVFQALLIVRIGVRTQVSIGPDHAVAEAQEHLIPAEQFPR